MPRLIYPHLPGARDLAVARIGGSGLGNCFFTYFHAFRLSLEGKARMVAPTWRSIRIGPLLRGERTLRHYSRELKSHPDEMQGARRLWLLATGEQAVSDALVTRLDGDVPSAGRGDLIRVEASRFTFVGLHEYREHIRRRLLDIMVHRPQTPSWGAGGYIAAHVRLGDFAVATQGQLETGRSDNLRVPLSWYAQAIALLRAEKPGVPVRIYSDGRAADLAELLKIDGVSLHAEPGDVDDLLSLASADILIGSESTFSRWAAFLGNMPSIWLRTAAGRERPTSADTPIAYLGFEDTALPQNFLTIGGHIA